MIELEGVAKRFGTTQALHPLSLRVAEGRTTAVIGPSGCGKSTLLRLVIGLIRPDEGTVRFDGEALRPETLRAARHRMGYVIQEGGLFPHLTARENITLLPRHVGWAEGRIGERVGELAELAQLPEARLTAYPAQLSGGQRQRVALMRALALDPAALLLDEPLGALDPMIRADLQDDLRRIFRTLGKTVLLVTHDIGEAGFFSDAIVLMREGRIEQEGTLEALVHAPASAFVEQFVNAQRSPLESVDRGL